MLKTAIRKAKRNCYKIRGTDHDPKVMICADKARAKVSINITAKDIFV